jgi:DNA-binding response OmpR family regulator
MTTSDRAAGSGRLAARPAGPATARILVVDDEPKLCLLLERALARDGFAADVATTAADGLQLAAGGGYDLVVLDLMLPDMDGRDALTAILRRRPGQPVLILSCITDVPAKVECLNRGALDYLAKPFALEEFLARVRARLRDGRREPAITQAGELVLDAGRLAACTGHGQVSLTRLEYMLLRALMQHAGQSVTKSDLLASVWGIDFDPGSNIVDVSIRRLRSKLGHALIETVRGEGYRLAC